MFTSIWRNFINFLLNFFLIRFHEKVFFLIILVFKSLNRFINGWIMTCLAKNEIYSLKWEKCARCAKMRRLVGARVIFFMRQVTAFFLFGCPSPIGRNKKVQFTTNQCYITNKSSFFAKNWTKSPDWGWKNCQSGIPLPIFETKNRSAQMVQKLQWVRLLISPRKLTRKRRLNGDSRRKSPFIVMGPAVEPRPEFWAHLLGH